MLEYGRSHLFPAGHSVYGKLPESPPRSSHKRWSFEKSYLFFFFCEITCSLFTVLLHEPVSTLNIRAAARRGSGIGAGGSIVAPPPPPQVARKRGHSGFRYIYLFAPRVMPKALSLDYLRCP